MSKQTFFNPMKKLLSVAFPVLAAVSAHTAAAQQPALKAPDADNVTICPERYIDRYDEGDCMLAVVNAESSQVTIYNSALTVVRSFSLVASPQTIVYTDKGDFQFSQYLFNDDEKFEYIVASDDYTKARVYNEDGVLVKEFDFGSLRLNTGFGGVTLLRLGYEMEYMQFQVNDGGYPYQGWIYPIGRATSSVRQVEAASSGLSVHPAVTNGSEPVEISLGAPADSATRVSVVAANGSQAMTKSIKAGESGISLNVGNLAKGVYVVNVAGRGQEKLIIR